jgi:hypothetical protein
VVREILERMRGLCREHYAVGLALGALLFGLAATSIVYSLLAQFVEREATLRFENDSRSVEQQIATRVRLYSDVLVTMRALMSADVEVTRSEFRDFVVGLDCLGGILASRHSIARSTFVMLILPLLSLASGPTRFCRAPASSLRFTRKRGVRRTRY